MLPSWVDPHISLDGIAAIVTVLLAGGGAFLKVLRRFNAIEAQSKANAKAIDGHGAKLDQFGDMLVRMERSDGRVNMLERIVTLQGKRIDELTGAILKGISTVPLPLPEERGS